MDLALDVFTRWLHIASAVALVGGIVYARLAATPAMNVIPADARNRLAEAFGARFRRLAISAVVALLVSGLYRFMLSPFRERPYHMIFGIKVLLALHVFAVAILLVTPASSPEKLARRPRMMTGVIISGLAIIALSAYLRLIPVVIK